ncbi:ATP-binding protein [Teredinibacter turnerae]|uniref:PAS domain-containing sensor histidine kinase n=1 Tax=Teredinibacter turnerae TaxID=2426 RepID=UPI0003820AEC|nr:ATP-binding protein [Teredinibacter turnerae]
MVKPVTNTPSDPNAWLTYWPDGAIVLDENGRILAICEHAQAILGWRPEQLIGQMAHDRICISTRRLHHAPEDCPICRDADSTTVKSSFWLSAEGDYVSVDYRTARLPLAADGHFVVRFHRNEQQDYSFAELQKFADFVDKNPAAIVEFDEFGQMLFCNPAMQHLMMTHGFDDQGHARIMPRDINEICAQIVASQNLRAPVEVAVDDFWFNWHFSPLVSPVGQSVIGYVFDVSDVKRAQAQASVARAQARRDFYAKMIHELRTPLNAIVGYSDLLLCRNAENLKDRDLKALRGIKVGGMQLNELISDTLDISKIEAGKMTTEITLFRPQDVLDEIHEQMHYLAEMKKLRYEVHCPPEFTVASDVHKVRQILINLISNAVKYTRKGQVSVVVQPLDVEPPMEDCAEEFLIEVADTGMGIPADQLDTLFDSYQRVKESNTQGIQGTGLGLALVNDVVEILGGEISVASEYGAGSRFSVRLPTQSSVLD